MCVNCRVMLLGYCGDCCMLLIVIFIMSLGWRKMVDVVWCVLWVGNLVVC